MKVQVFNKTDNILPQYAREGDAGLDLRANLNGIIKVRGEKVNITTNGAKIEQVIIEPGGRALIPTGLHVSIPEGYELQIRPRSGLAVKHGITVLNTPGTVDSGFKDEIGVILINHSSEWFSIEHGDRIAQAVLNKVEHIDWEPVDDIEELEGSNRGGGFGSTKIK